MQPHPMELTDAARSKTLGVPPLYQTFDKGEDVWANSCVLDKRGTSSMRTTRVIMATALLALAGAPAFATGIGNQINQAIVDGYAPGLKYPDTNETRLPNGHIDDTITLGDAIQGGFYGNAVNTRGTNNGHGTLPSLAPGPQACDPDEGCDTIIDGANWGDIKRVINPAALGAVGP